MIGWQTHEGKGRPIPVGTLVDVRRFNGDVDRIIAGAGPTVAPDGTVIDSSRARWSGWDHFDGGPMAVKFRAYRVVNLAPSERAENRMALRTMNSEIGR